MSLKLRSPIHEEASITISEDVSNLQKSFNGTVCSKKGDEYAITDNIIDFWGKGPSNLSWAQRSNDWKLTAAIYEDIWRKRSLRLLSGQDFPIEKEKNLLVEWLDPKLDASYLDVGCSTALYGREVKKRQARCEVVALDFSRPMLQEARHKAQAERVNLFLLQADARYMPFFGATFDGLMMGGTLNELSDPLKVLFECRRVIRKEGTFFMMHLLKANTWYGRLLQESAKFGGLQFWSIEESNQLFERAGFSVAKQSNKGIVCFSKLLPV
ncbi:MAG TPA: methyltransferase domain-containing protein [Balneolaceae bacterium]|nr:methyltransferase domain-containing protein [Balneolaceae bacterium]